MANSRRTASVLSPQAARPEGEAAHGESATAESTRGTAETRTPAKRISPADNTLRVALDVRTWGMSGLGTYLRGTLQGFAASGLPVAWTIVGPEEVREQLPPGLEIARWIDFNASLYSIPGSLFYPALGKVDVFHHPHYNLPLARVRRRVVTAFDLFHLKYGVWAKQHYQQFFLRRMRWSGATVLTACEKVKQELIELGRLAPGQIKVITLGAGPEAPRTPPAPADVTSLGGTPLKGRWLLSVGIDQPHKNFDFLLTALTLYFKRRPGAPPFVWTGLAADSLASRSRTIHAEARRGMALESYADAERLERLYAGAFALIFPSLDEGFGLPPLEAMARGIPVICARREPMLSTLGDAALYFEPRESASLWRMIDRLLDSPALREEMIARGRARAARYRWERTACETFSAYAATARKPQLVLSGEATDAIVAECRG